MQPEQEVEIVSGLLPFTINGETRLVPELKWTQNRAWKATMRATFARLVTVPTETPDGQDAMLDAERELVLSYDATHVLGDLDDATETEIDAIYNGLVKVAFPLASSPMAVGLMMVRAAMQSAQASSQSGPSTPGTSSPTILKDHLPSARSTSSTRKPKSGSPRSNATA
jgi:hypothetical protein